MKKFKITWLLGGVFLLLVAYVYFVEIKGAEKKKEIKTQKEKVLAFDKNDVQTIILKNSNGTFQAKNIGENSWIIEKPIKALADKYTWNSILDAVYDLKFTRVISESGGDLEPYGLSSAATQVELQLSGKKERLALQIGDENPIGDSLFATDLKAKKVVLVPKSITYSLDKDLMALREKKLFGFKVNDAREIEFIRKGSRWVLKKEGAKWHVLSAKDKLEADPSKVREILNALSYLSVAEFEGDDAKDKGKFGLIKPQLSVNVRDGKTTQLALLFGSEKDNNVYVSKKAEKPVYQVGSAVLKKIPEHFSMILKKVKEKKKTEI